jgi:hypothetical protein
MCAGLPTPMTLGRLRTALQVAVTVAVNIDGHRQGEAVLHAKGQVEAMKT